VQTGLRLVGNMLSGARAYLRSVPGLAVLVPVLINAAGEPEVSDGENVTRILAAVADRSAPLGTRLALDGARARPVLPA